MGDGHPPSLQLRGNAAPCRCPAELLSAEEPAGPQTEAITPQRRPREVLESGKGSRDKQPHDSHGSIASPDAYSHEYGPSHLCITARML